MPRRKRGSWEPLAGREIVSTDATEIHAAEAERQRQFVKPTQFVDKKALRGSNSKTYVPVYGTKEDSAIRNRDFHLNFATQIENGTNRYPITDPEERAATARYWREFAEKCLI